MTANTAPGPRDLPVENRSTRLYVTIQGVLGGVVAMVHGLAEILQGNRTTSGNWLVSIGAFTLIHNYLATGIAVLIVSLCLLVWTAGWIQTRPGAAVFLGLAVLLFLVGGGVAQVVFFVIAWAVATRIRSPLAWWQDHVPERTLDSLAKNWGRFLGLGYFFLAAGILIWLIWTPPGATYKAPIAQYLCWASLLAGLLFQVLTIVSGFARDLRKRTG